MKKIKEILKKDSFTKESYVNILNLLEKEKLRLENKVFMRRVGGNLNTEYEDKLDEEILSIEKSIEGLKSLNKFKQ